MFFVMVEISNYRQLSRLRAAEAAELRGMLEHFCHNRGGRLVREQSGFFLFSFHPLREKVLEQVSDFLFLTAESLLKKQDELFGFSLVLEQDEQNDEVVFNRLKALTFLAPRSNRVWAGSDIQPLLDPLLPMEPGHPLAEILGPPRTTALPPLSVDHLMEMTGWIEALKTPLSRQLAEAGPGRPGKILRLKGSHLTEKFFVLKTVLQQIYGAHEDFPVLFPFEESRDFLSQLLARVETDRLKKAPKPPEPAWDTLLHSQGGGDYPGDSSRHDVVGALGHYFSTLIQQLEEQGLPPVFVFLVPHQYELQARDVLDSILGDLVARGGLRLLLLEPQEKSSEFLTRYPSLSWSFPPLTWERSVRERDARGWQDRFPVLSKEVITQCQGRGMAWVHHLWLLQQAAQAEATDPSLALFQSLDAVHHKVYYLLWAGRGLLEESHLVEFFEAWGEDALVVADKVKALRAMGFFVGGIPFTLRPDFGEWLTHHLGEEGRELLKGLGDFLFQRWRTHHRLSEVLFSYLGEWGLPQESGTVLGNYLTNKVNQGQGDFLRLLGTSLWRGAPEPWADRLRLVAAAAKLRYALNKRSAASAPSLDRLRKHFTPRTEAGIDGEWALQRGRYDLRMGALDTGFSWLKKALLEAQEKDDRALEVRSQVEIGLALIRKRRVEEGRDYLDIAARLAERHGSPYLVTITASLLAVAQFLLGNLTSGRKLVDRAAVAADQGGLRRWRVFLSFLLARIEFDQGAYPSAADVLDDAASFAEKFKLADALPVIRAWRARCDLYRGDPLGARARLEVLPASAERSFFLAETLHRERNRSALEHIAQARELLVATQPFGRGENVDWTTGFAAIEDRALGQPGDLGVLGNQIEAFELLLEGVYGGTDVSERFQTLLSRKALIELDPVSAHYYYWYYLVLPKQGQHEAQGLTLLGRSLKDLQVRSSRIEDPGQRQDYLSRPLWTAQFSQEARKLKLL